MWPGLWGAAVAGAGREGRPTWGPAVLCSKASCPAGLAQALEGQAQEDPWGPVTGDQPGVPPAQVPGSSGPSSGCWLAGLEGEEVD